MKGSGSRFTLGAFSRAWRWIAMPAVFFSCFSCPAWATNRFFVNDQFLSLGSSGNRLPILADLDQETLAFSVHLAFDSSLVQVMAMELGLAVSALSPEFSSGTIDNSSGDVTHGVIFVTSGLITRKLSPGTGEELLKLVVDVIASSPSTTLLDLVNAPGSPTIAMPRLNVMTDSTGESVNPPPTLTDGTLSLTDLGPRITGFSMNGGLAGKDFLVTGENFDRPGLSVAVCSQAAAFVLLPDLHTIKVTAPGCGSGPQEVRVCTAFGCASDPKGFTYEGTRFIRGNANNDSRVDLSDAITILQYLFAGVPPRAPCQDALDTNDSGRVDLSDAIYLLSYLFQGARII